METAQKIAIRILELDPNWVQDRIWLDSHKIVEAMKAYAMQECEKVRQDCADNITQAAGTFNSDYSSQKRQILSTSINLT